MFPPNVKSYFQSLTHEELNKAIKQLIIAYNSQLKKGTKDD